MSALGQMQTCATQKMMSALPLKADMRGPARNVCYGPKVEIRASEDHAFDLERKAAARGKIILISVNSPGKVWTSIDPPCCLTMMS
jgi:hypothetical protein